MRGHSRSASWLDEGEFDSLPPALRRKVSFHLNKVISSRCLQVAFLDGMPKYEPYQAFLARHGPQLRCPSFNYFASQTRARAALELVKGRLPSAYHSPIGCPRRSAANWAALAGERKRSRSMRSFPGPIQVHQRALVYNGACQKPITHLRICLFWH